MWLRWSSMLALFLLQFSLFGQDVIFSQLYNNHLYLNPALTGREIHPNFGLHYRNQWPKLNYNFQTPSMQFDQRIENFSSGFGVYFMHDFVGGNSSASTSHLALNYAYYQKLPHNFELSMGFRTALGVKQINLDAISYGDMIDPREGLSHMIGDAFVTNRTLYPDIGAGVSLTGHGLFLGASGNHLNRPNVSMTQSPHRLAMNFSFYGGYNIRIPFSDETDKHVFTITPHGSYHIFDLFSTYTGGLYLSFINITLAANYSEGNLYTGLLGYDFNFGRLAYSYVHSNQDLIFNSGGIHEISLNWRLGVGKGTPIQRNQNLPQY